ncbi:MAG: roadblock/LC7 domain-containing protein [Thermomicrobiaceae bacterium]|nr:roadblock/LC7 domain-containing protein [Thermomicrobiaceae bacterium]
MAKNTSKRGASPGDSRPPFDRTLSNLVVTEEDTAQITACLQRLMADTGASYSMVIDHAGQILAWESDSVRPEMTHLGALLAATYASTQQMARLLNEDGFKTLLQEGLREKIFTETVKDRWLLVVIFDHQVHLGLVKVLAKRATAMLGTILDLVEERQAANPGALLPYKGKASTDTIDLLFRDDDDDSE